MTSSFYRTGMVVSIVVILILAAGSCSSNGTTSAGERGTVSSEESSLSKDLQAGSEIYKKYCLSCHQVKGSGVTGMYPPLVSNPNLKLSKDSLIYIVLRGKAGKLEVNGQVYAGIMAPHNYLSDSQVANVLNYILNGMNKYESRIEVDEVTAIRQKLK